MLLISLYITSLVMKFLYIFIIRYLMNKSVANRRITRWILLLREFDVMVLDRPGKENQVVDFLSSLNHPGEYVPVNENFPHENLFSITIKTPWFADMAN